MKVTRWLIVRAILAVGVLALIVPYLTGHRTPAVVITQAVLILGILATVALDARDMTRRSSGNERSK